MAEAREIKVQLTADVEQYVEAMDRASVATSRLAEVLKACGITEADMPAAIKGVIALIRDADAA